jgi:hypothetical protein
MSASEDRLRSLKRIVRLQAQMRRREEWRLAALEREDNELAQRQHDLAVFFEAESSVSSLMAGATARHLQSVAQTRARLTDRKAAQSAEVVAQQARLNNAERRHDEVAALVAREREDDDLQAVVEAAMGRRGTSLP